MNKFHVLGQAKRQACWNFTLRMSLGKSTWGNTAILVLTQVKLPRLVGSAHSWQAAFWLALNVSLTPHFVSLNLHIVSLTPLQCVTDPHDVSLPPTYVVWLTPHIVSLTPNWVCRRDHHLLCKLMAPHMPHSDRGRPMTWGSWHIAQKPRHEALCSNVNAY